MGDTIGNSPPAEELPFDGHYLDIDCVPSYAGWLFQQRLAYLDWIIGIRQTQTDAWDAAQDPSDFVATEHHLRLESVQNQRRLELADREPLPEWQRGATATLPI
jgi:hypothetical protein